MAGYATEIPSVNTYVEKDVHGTGKPGAVHADEVESATSQDSLDFEHDHEFSLAAQRKIKHKIDRRLITMCGAMYCVSLMDRTNLGAAVLAGMAVDLDLIGFRYSTIALVFFVTYVLCQPPATILCRKIGPRYFLATITLMWGIVEIGFGFPKTWTEMIGEFKVFYSLPRHH
jgi:sugar phosphate permease